MGAMQDFISTVGSWFKDDIKIRSINKAKLLKWAKTNIEGHDQIADLFTKFSNMANKTIGTEYGQKVAGSTLASNNIYLTYYHGLSNRAQTNEDRQFMSTLAKSNAEMKKILQEIVKKIDTFIEGDSINLFNTRITAVAVLGILRQSDVLRNWTYYFWSQVILVLTNREDSIKRYRTNYLINHVADITFTVNQLTDKSGIYMFLLEAEQLRRKNADLILNFTGPNPGGVAGVLNPAMYTRGFTANLGSALAVLNIVRFLQERWDVWQHAKYLEDKYLLSWMEGHVALLRMQLDGVSPDDPKYTAQLKVIDNYDNEITNLAEKIRDYENGD